MNKYHNRKATTGDGIKHDSRREAVRWCELNLLQRKGIITGLRRQVKFVLIPTQYGTGLKGKKKLLERECSYLADFVYKENDQLVVEDTKGYRTKEYVIKRKLMLYVHGIKIQEV